MIELAEIWRHPIKAIGRESLDRTVLAPNKTLPWDRHWAVSRKDAKIDPENPKWVRCVNFLRGASLPALQAIETKWLPEKDEMVLTHPDYEECVFSPADTKTVQTFFDWLTPFWDKTQIEPDHLIALPARGFTDSETGMISLMNLNSLDDFNKNTGQNFSTKRWRGNFWLHGLPAWEERKWIGKTIQIGTAKLQILKNIERCQMVSANPETGERDCDAPALLRECFSHQDFGVSAYVVEGGEIGIGDKVKLS